MAFNEIRTMHMLAILTTLVILSISSVSAFNRPPVFMFFEHENCSGSSYYENWDPLYDVCETNGDDSYIYRRSDTNIEFATYYGSRDCGGGGNDAVINRGRVIYFGVCTLVGDKELPNPRMDGYNGYILLRNIQDEYTAPQQPFLLNTSVPVVPTTSWIPCNNTANCESMALEFYQFQTIENGTCIESDSRSRFDYLAGIEHNKCYRDETEPAYAMRGCKGPHTSETTYYIDSACTKPMFSTLRGGKCRRGSDLTTHCIAGRRTEEGTITSPASTFQPTTFISVAIIVLAMFL